MKNRKILLAGLSASMMTGALLPFIQTAAIYAEQSGKWMKDSGGWWYQYADGTYPISTWKKIDGQWYWFTSSGYMKTGWGKINGSWYYFGSSGAMKTGWGKISGSWYYFGSNGAMKTGWAKIHNEWYYFDESGAMKTGWIQSGGKDYLLDASGKMLANRIVGNTYLGADGAAIDFISLGISPELAVEMIEMKETYMDLFGYATPAMMLDYFLTNPPEGFVDDSDVIYTQVVKASRALGLDFWKSPCANYLYLMCGSKNTTSLTQSDVKDVADRQSLNWEELADASYAIWLQW